MKEGAFLQRLIFFREETSGRRSMLIMQAIREKTKKKKNYLKLRCRFCCLDTLAFLAQFLHYRTVREY